MKTLYNREALNLAIFVFIMLAGAVVLDALSDDSNITGQSLKSMLKKIKRQVQASKPKPPQAPPQPTLPIQVISPTPAGQCLDSDSGWDIFQSGKVNMGPAIICTDRCATAEELQRSQGKDKLFECFCGNKQASGGGQGSGWTDCAYGCKDAACISQTPMPAENTENVLLLLYDKPFVRDGTVLDANALTLYKPFLINFLIENQGIQQYSPGYLIQILDDKNNVVYQVSRTAFDTPIAVGEQRKLSHEIDYERYRGQMDRIQPQLIYGNTYTIKIRVSKKQGETNIADNEKIIKFKVGMPQPVQTPPAPSPAPVQSTAKLKEVTGARPQANYVSQPSSTATAITALPPEVGV